MLSKDTVSSSRPIVNVSHPEQTIEQASSLASLSWGVIPVRHNKKPALSSWKEFQNRRATPDELKTWFGPHMIGIVTGSISGLVVVDCDSQEAVELVMAMLPEGFQTPMATTPRGLHLYFKEHVEPIKNGVNVLSGVDVRGEGGYVVAPPGPGRDWIIAPEDCPLAELPPALAEIMSKDQKAQSAKSPANTVCYGANTIYGLAVLKNETQRLLSSPIGQRNDTLNKVAFRLGQLAAQGQLSQMKTEEALMDAANKLGLSPLEARKTIASGLYAGQQRPNLNLSEPVGPDWPDPVPFDDFAAPALPVDCLPSWAAKFTKAAAEQVQVPTCMSMANVLGAFATASARKFVVELKPGLREPVNLYLLSTGLPGERKTQIQGVCFRPLWD